MFYKINLLLSIFSLVEQLFVKSKVDCLVVFKYIVTFTERAFLGVPPERAAVTLHPGPCGDERRRGDVK